MNYRKLYIGFFIGFILIVAIILLNGALLSQKNSIYSIELNTYNKSGVNLTENTNLNEKASAYGEIGGPPSNSNVTPPTKEEMFNESQHYNITVIEADNNTYVIWNFSSKAGE